MADSMVFTLAELAAKLDARVQGDGDTLIRGLAALDSATASDLSFLANWQYRKLLASTRAGAVLLTEDDAADFTGNALIVADPYLAYARISHQFDPRPRSRAGVHPTAVIAESASVDPSASIGPGVVIEADAVVGGEGFGFANQGGRWNKIAQIGGVLIGGDVEIGANTTVDRGALSDTVIGNGVKLDNQIQIAHNVQIGDHTAMAACVGISGSTRIGRHCMIAGGVGMVGHIEICDNVFVSGMTMVTRSITEPGAYSSGTAMQTAAEWKKSAARIRQLDTLAKRVQQLEKQLAGVTQPSQDSSES